MTNIDHLRFHSLRLQVVSRATVAFIGQICMVSRKCFWEPKTEWSIVMLRGLVEARMWNFAAEYAAIHGLGSYFLEFACYKGIELTDKPFRGSDGGELLFFKS